MTISWISETNYSLKYLNSSHDQFRILPCCYNKISVNMTQYQVHIGFLILVVVRCLWKLNKPHGPEMLRTKQ
jgi:hypothetical protein